MKRLAFLAIAAALALGGCTRAAPDNGEEGVIIAKPYFFGHGGVDPDPVKTGLSFLAFSSSVKYVSMNPQAFNLEYSDVMSSNGIPLAFHATVTLKVTDSVRLVNDFGGGGWQNGTENKTWYENNIQAFLNSTIRDGFREHEMQKLAIENEGTIAVEKQVKEKLTAYLAKINLPATVVNFTVGKVNPPEDIKRQRVKTAEEQQRQQTELQTKIAETNRAGAETARALADNAYRQAMNLSPEQFVELERIHMTQKICDDKACNIVLGNGGVFVGGK